MKYMNAKKKYQSLDLQIFAEGDGGDGGDAGDDDDPDDDDDDPDDPDEKKFSQKDVDAAVSKRLEREKRKWKREQQKKTSGPDGGGKAGDGEGTHPESEDVKARKVAEDKVSSLEVKVACYEAGVVKDAVEDVSALAKAYMTADENLDLEDAIEKVVKKYPQFKKELTDPYEEEGKGKAWGERQKGNGRKKLSAVEERFYELNPDLKK